MKNIKAALIALILFALTVTGVKLYLNNKMPEYNLSYGTWINPAKFSCNNALNKLLEDKNTMFVFGSSEFRHGQRTRYHGKKMYRGTDIKPVLIGQGGYQSLYHAITLGSLNENIKNRKIMICVSPQWFKRGGVKTDAFGASFSDSNFIAMLKNKNVSDDSKEYIINRALKLTSNNSAMNSKIKNDVNWYKGKPSNPIEMIRKGIHSYLVEEKSNLKLLITDKLDYHKRFRKPVRKIKKINWKKYYRKAKKDGRTLAKKNKVGMMDKIYDSKFKAIMNSGNVMKADYSKDSVEYKDFECFLQICKEENVKVDVMILPYNGKWYDHMSLSKQTRQNHYKKLRDMASNYGANITDLSKCEYDEFMFEDDCHFALKGLVRFYEEIYKFNSKN